MATTDEVVILGAGMHPWGKWGRNFVDYGVAAARAALAEAELPWNEVQFVAGGSTMRCGYPGYVAGATFAQALGWQGAQVASCYAACATGAQALQAARQRILAGLCDVALVVGADTTPKGFLAPQGGERPDDPDWVRFRLGLTNTIYFGLYAQRRMSLYGATAEDFARVKVKNAQHGLHNPNARYRKACALEDVMASPVVSSPLRLLDICATSDGGAAVVLASADYARRHNAAHAALSIAAVATSTPRFPCAEVEMPDIATDSAAAVAASGQRFRSQVARDARAEAGIGAQEIDVAEVYDLSTAMELDWCEDLELIPEGEAERWLAAGDTAVGGRMPVNPSGGLACFGEAVPAQGLAQVCELSWQLRGMAGQRQVAGARIGISANQGLFGHASAVILRGAVTT